MFDPTTILLILGLAAAIWLWLADRDKVGGRRAAAIVAMIGFLAGGGLYIGREFGLSTIRVVPTGLLLMERDLDTVEIPDATLDELLRRLETGGLSATHVGELLTAAPDAFNTPRCVANALKGGKIPDAAIPAIADWLIDDLNDGSITQHAIQIVPLVLDRLPPGSPREATLVSEILAYSPDRYLPPFEVIRHIVATGRVSQTQLEAYLAGEYEFEAQIDGGRPEFEPSEHVAIETWAESRYMSHELGGRLLISASDAVAAIAGDQPIVRDSQYRFEPVLDMTMPETPGAYNLTVQVDRTFDPFDLRSFMMRHPETFTHLLDRAAIPTARASKTVIIPYQVRPSDEGD